jgi:hypothetical protein
LVEAEKKKQAPDLDKLSDYLDRLSLACYMLGDKQNEDRYAKERETVLEQLVEAKKCDKK